MDTQLAKNVIGVIRAERDSRRASLRDQDPDVAYDVWVFRDEPFINELCLMLLVAIRHHVERELVWAAARVTSDRRPLKGDEYSQRVQDERQKLRTQNGWSELAVKLELHTFTEWASSMETLRLLANSYKHDPASRPDRKLLEHLHLDWSLNYGPLPESPALRTGLAAYLDLEERADYCDIAEELLRRADTFVAEVQRRPDLSPVKWGPVSLNPDDFFR